MMLFLAMLQMFFLEMYFNLDTVPSKSVQFSQLGESTWEKWRYWEYVLQNGISMIHIFVCRNGAKVNPVDTQVLFRSVTRDYSTNTHTDNFFVRPDIRFNVRQCDLPSLGVCAETFLYFHKHRLLSIGWKHDTWHFSLSAVPCCAACVVVVFTSC